MIFLATWISKSSCTLGNGLKIFVMVRQTKCFIHMVRGSLMILEILKTAGSVVKRPYEFSKDCQEFILLTSVTHASFFSSVLLGAAAKSLVRS